MKLLIQILTLVTFVSSIYSQNINILDEKYGFKDLKFKSEKSDIQNELDYMFRDKLTGGSFYEYVGESIDIKSVFDIFFQKLLLRYDDLNQLSEIYLIKKYPPVIEDDLAYKRNSKDFQELLSNFQTILGKQHDTETDEAEGLINILWLGKKVALKITTEYNGIDKESRIVVAFLEIESYIQDHSDKLMEGF